MSKHILKRALLVAGLALLVGLAESAVLAAAREPAPDALRALSVVWIASAALAAFLYVLPLPARWLALVPLAWAGAEQCSRVGGGAVGDFHGTAGLLAVLHVLVVGALGRALLMRARGPAGAAAPFARERTWAWFALVYGVQAWAGSVLWAPATQAPRALHVAAVLASATALPMLAGAVGARLLSPRPGVTFFPALARTFALAALLVLGLSAARTPWLLFSHVALPPPPPARADLPDVVLVVLDTTRADRTSVHGAQRATTPALERFARTATVFDEGVSPAVWTLPGHASLFTGLYPPEHGVDQQTPLPRATVTLAEWFRAAGYHTGCVAANQLFRADAHYGLEQGFEFLYCEQPLLDALFLPRASMRLARALAPVLPRRALVGWHGFLGPARPALSETLSPAPEILRTATAWWDAMRGEHPRFLVVNLMEAHGMSRTHGCGAPRFHEGAPLNPYRVRRYARVAAGFEDADPQDLQRLADAYDSSLACMDRHLGDFFDALRGRAEFDPSVIAVTADHGEMLGDHRAFGHRSEVWQGLVHVPLLVKRPGQVHGERSSEPMDTASLAAALPALAGLAPLESIPAWAGSLDCVPAFVRQSCTTLDAEAAPVQRVAGLPVRRLQPLSAAAPSEGQADDLSERWHAAWLALRDGTRKFVKRSDGSTWCYDLGSDPGEAAPLPWDDDLSARLDALLSDWRVQELDLSEARSAHANAGNDVRTQVLRQLGYAGDR